MDSIIKEIELDVSKSIDEVAENAKRIMREEVHRTVGTNSRGKYKEASTGKLENSIHIDKVSKYIREVGTDIPYAQYVINGRGEIDMRKASTKKKFPNSSYPLKWKSNGKTIYSYKSAAVKSNDFFTRAYDRLVMEEGE